MKSLGVGAALTGLVTVLLVLVWGRPGLLPALAFGGLATVIQVASVGLMRPVVSGPSSAFLGRWGIGMLLRGLGILVLAGAALIDPLAFPPLPSALGYLGVLIPLLFLEVRFIRC